MADYLSPFCFNFLIYKWTWYCDIHSIKIRVKNLKCIYFHLFERHRDTERERDRDKHRKICWFTPKTLGLGEVKSRRLEVSVSFPCRRPGLNYLIYHLPPPRVHVSRRVESEVKGKWSPVHFGVECRSPKQYPNCCIEPSHLL